jgi:acyl dehydratase
LRAVNTAAESENKIHDDRVAAEFGFRGGLVPGVTVYGYLASAAMEHFGARWLESGAMDVRFAEPVYEGEEIEVALTPEAQGRARVSIAKRATGIAWNGEHAAAVEPREALLESRRAASAETLAAGTVLGSLHTRLDLAASRMSAPLDAAIGATRIAHPAILLALANEILVRNYALGPWIHVGSEVRKFSSARDGEELAVRASIVEQYERKGHEFAVLNVVIHAGDRLVEHVRHTAIWRPRRAG